MERALRGTAPGLSVGGRVLDRLRDHADTLERRVLDPELDDYRERARRQFGVVLDYAEGETPIEAYRDELLAHDTYVSALDESVSDREREAVVADVLDRHRRLGDGLRPVVASDHEEFWPAAVEGLDRAAATELIEEAFPFTGPLRRHREVIAMEVQVDPGEVLGGLAGALPSVGVEYTDEALRAMTRAEERIVHDLGREVGRRFEA